jgi:hypothetical protein
MKRQIKRLDLNRETVRRLDGELEGVDGGAFPMNTAGTCPVTACICVTGIICGVIRTQLCSVAETCI